MPSCIVASNTSPPLNLSSSLTSSVRQRCCIRACRWPRTRRTKISPVRSPNGNCSSRSSISRAMRLAKLLSSKGSVVLVPRTTWEQMFHCRAVSASIFFPNKSNSFALESPIDSMKVAEEHNSGTNANLVKGAQSVAFSVQKHKSQCISRVTPIPTAGPLTATARILGNSIKAIMKRPGGILRVSRADPSSFIMEPPLRSAPLEKYEPIPVKTIAENEESDATSVMTSTRSR
mmetsp:Transcript_30828/g.50922  ORF Transcript_30828/g.50922 Transcript_30828/m.50922 type:complete len:232 (-) Transcript_30828:253-948(-)